MITIIISVYKFEYKYKGLENTINMKVKVISLKKLSEEKISYLVKYNNDNFLLNLYKNKYDNNINLLNNEVFEYGDILNLNGKINIPEVLGNPYEFNYKRYLNSNDVLGTITTYKIEKIRSDKNNILFSVASTLKKDYEEKVLNNLNFKEASFLIATLFSDDVYMEEDFKEIVNNLNLAYIFSISSKNIFSVFLVVNLFRRVFKDKTINIMKIFLCIFIYILSSMSYSTLRAIIFILINFILPKDLKLTRLHKLIISMYIILIINPYSAFNYSFIFTYLIVISSIYFYNVFNSYVAVKIKILFRYNKIFGYKKKILNFLLKIISIMIFNISVIIFIFPMQISISNSFNFISIISNIFVIPLLSIIHFLGYLSIFFTYIFNLGDIIINSTYLPIKCLIRIIEYINKFSLDINLATFSYFSFFLYYFMLFLTIFKDKILNRFILKNKKKRKVLRIIINIVLLLSILFIIFEQFYIVNFESYIIYFNVKQGNMCLIKNKDEIVIVDIGSTTEKLAANIMNNFLKAKNIDKIDLVLMTHMHSDHINGIYDLDDKIIIKKVAFGKIWHNITNEYNEVINLLNFKNIKYFEVKNGDNLELKNIKIKVISPDENFKINAQDEINANSAVYDVYLKNKRFLFMGDATKETESYILKNENLNFDKIFVLQVGHHGSKTSSSEEFISRLDLRIALISSYKKVYSHPSNETIDTFEKYKLKYHITEINKALKLRL